MEARDKPRSDTKHSGASTGHASVKSEHSGNDSINFDDEVFFTLDLNEQKIEAESSRKEEILEPSNESMQSYRIPSKPINIPRLQVSAIDSISEEESGDFCITPFPGTPPNSVGDTVYSSPKLPRPSNDFSHVMVKLKKRTDIQRVRSCDDVVVTDSDGESCASPCPISSSLPSGSISRATKGRRSVRFDEATITLTAELGESAARFRSQWRKKRLINNPNRFGESKNIIVQHSDEEVPSPQLERAAKTKSIFDVCNYSSYGRYT